MGPDALSRYRAERLLRKDFAGLRAKVLAVVRAQLRGKGVTLDPSDLEAYYAQAWHGLYATVLGGERVENPSAWLVLVTFRRAIDESRAARRIGVVDVEDLGSFPGRSDGAAESLADELDNRARLRHVFEGMRATLSERECEAASLCYLQGLTRAEAAERMGMSEARMGKLMEGAGPSRPGVAAKVGGLLETIRAGGWCEQQSSLMRAYAFGILDPEGERHALAVAHCRECPACRAHVASLRGLASVLPLPFISPAMLAAGAGVTAAGSGAGAIVGAGSGAGATGAAGGLGAAVFGWTPAARLTAIGLRVGVGVGRGWSAVAGSLIAKLAAAAIVVVGAGYGLLGSRAHGSPPRRAAPSNVAGTVPAAPARVAADVLSPSPFAVPNRRPTTSRARSARSSPTTRSTGHTATGEFSPERVRLEQTVAGPTPAPTSTPTSPRSQGGPTGAAGEFGIE
jgi:DNA-directed RNA polymerase specialized sigma24 family protein